MEGSTTQAAFYYQNNIAALKILDCLLFESEIHYIHLESYMRGNHIDDVIIYRKTGVEFIQVKWSQDEENSYTLFYLLNPQGDSKSIFKQLAEGYLSIKEKTNAKIILFTTKRESNQKRPAAGITHGLTDFRTSFLNPFQAQQGLYKDLHAYNTYKEIIEKIRTETGLGEALFGDFLRTLDFQFSQEGLSQIKSLIKIRLARLGLEESIYEKLIDGAVNWSITGEQITRHTLLKHLGILDRFEDKLSHFFKVVDDKYYIPNIDLIHKLSTALSELDGGYIFIEGVPGMGKSTALTKFKQHHHKMALSYYCYIPDAKSNFGDLRHKAEYFLQSLCVSIENSFTEVNLPGKYSDRYEEKLTAYLDALSQKGKKVVIIVDGLDHVHRDLEFRENSLLNQIKGILPKGIFFVLSSQYPAALSDSVREQISADSRRHIIVTKFTQGQIHQYLLSKGIKPDEIVEKVEHISGGIPLYLHYISELLVNPSENSITNILDNLPQLIDGKINTYHESLFKQIENDEFSRWVLAVLAYRKENTNIDTLHKILKHADESKSITDVSNVIRRFSHLLKISNARAYAIFHNSFREFILSKTVDLKDRFNNALVEFYEQQPNADEAYRNYFRHLTELGKTDKIISLTTHAWLKNAWANFRTLPEIQENIRLAMQATIETASLSEFIRIGFIKAQFDRLSWNLDRSEIDFSILFLNAGLEANSIRSIWDGDFVLINRNYFCYYLTEYYKKTGRGLPNEIVKQGLSNQSKDGNAKTMVQVFTAEILADADPIELFNDIDAIQWVRSSNHAGSYDKEAIAAKEARKINFGIKRDLIEALRDLGRLDNLLTLSKAFPKKPKLTLLINIALFELILKTDKKEAVKLLQTLDITSLSEKRLKKLVIDSARFLSNAEVAAHFPKIEIHDPALHDKVIQNEHVRYRIHDDIINLFNELKLLWLYAPENYTQLFLKVSVLPNPARSIYNFVFELSRLWHDSRTSALPSDKKKEAFKRALKFLYTRKNDESRPVSRGLFDTDTETSFIRSDIHRLYRIFFSLANDLCTVEELLSLNDYWRQLESEGQGYGHYFIALTFAQTLNSGPHRGESELTLKIIQYAEEIVREEHETVTLSDYLAKVADTYGKCGFQNEFNRLYNQLLEVSFGVDYRKDYQASYVVDALEVVHKSDQEATIKRLFDVLNVQLRLAYAGNARMIHICLSDIIRFVAGHYPELAFELLGKEDNRIGRDEAMEIILTPLVEKANKDDLPYLFGIIKTLARWDEAGSKRDNHFVNLATRLLKRSIELSQRELAIAIVDLVKYTVTVELSTPVELNKLATLVAEIGGDPQTYGLPDAVLAPAQPDRYKRNGKFEARINVLSPDEFIKLFELNDSRFAEYLDNIYKSDLSNKRDRALRNEYARSKGLFQKYYDELRAEIQSLISSNSRQLIRLYIDFKNKIRNSKETIFKASDIGIATTGLIDAFCLLIGDDKFRQYTTDKIDLAKWQDSILQYMNDRREYASVSFLTDATIYKLVEDASILRWNDIAKFIEAWTNEKVRAIALLKLANRILAIHPEEAKKLFREIASDERYKLVYPRGDDSQALGFNPVDSLLKADPEFGKRFLLQSFLAQEGRYEFISRIDILMEYQQYFPGQNVTEVYYESNLQYNRELAKGLPERQDEHHFILNHRESMSFDEIAIKYISSILNYPVVKIRELALQSLFDLVKFDQRNLDLIFKHAIAQGTINQVEYALVIIHAIALDSPPLLVKHKSDLLALTSCKHFNILASLKDIFATLTLFDGKLLSSVEAEQINKLNTSSPIIYPSLITSVNGRKFLYSQFQTNLVLELQDNDSDEVDFVDALYGSLVAAGLGATTTEQENSVRRRYNINSNFDEIEINSPYYDEVNRWINETFHTKIRQGFFENDFVNDIRPKFRVYDPNNLLFRFQRQPAYINWAPASTSESDFMEFNDVEMLVTDLVNREEEYVTIAEVGNQWPIGQSRYTSFFEVYAFLASESADIASLERQQYDAMVCFKNLLLSELPITNTIATFPIKGIQPILEVSRNLFRGQKDDAIVSLTNDAFKLVGVEKISLIKMLMPSASSSMRAIKWQTEYSSDRRRYKAKSTGFSLKIKKSILSTFLSANGLQLCYDVHLKRSTTMHYPEYYMEWEDHTSKIRVNL